jgi:hypothetical protein
LVAKGEPHVQTRASFFWVFGQEFRRGIYCSAGQPPPT